MDYNARASQQFRSTTQNSRGTGQGRPKQDDSDAFMRLVPQPQFCQVTRILTAVQTDQEIAGCINDIGVPFTRDDLMKPQPQQIQKVFEWFAELLMNTTRETVEPAMRAAAEEVCKEHMDIVPSDTRNLMGFYASLRKLLVECGITDFSFSDLLRPTHDRLVKIFSYIINFVRFRETQTATMDEHFNKVEVTKTRIDTLYLENQDMEARLEEMRHERRLVESSAKEKQKRNEELKAKLLELNEGTYTRARLGALG
jgi:kinetochore protein Nuf2